MSQIKTTELEGDVSIGRHITAGGNATIRGNTTVGKNLTVEGWLDAKNIKGPNKGIFLSVTKLREAYPLPHDGWWALVGNTLPAPLYIADGGAWVATGESAGNPTIDSQQYNEAVAALDAELEAVAGDVEDNKQSISQIRTQIDTIGGSVNTLTSDVSGLKTRMTTAEGSITSINNSKGQPNGLAPLDNDGRVPSSYLPGSAHNMKEFDGFAFGSSYHPASSTKNSTDSGCSVIFNADLNAFLLRVTEEQTGGLMTITNYPNWADRYLFGSSEGIFCTPHKGKVYVDTTTNCTYRWSGSNMVVIGSDLALGRTSSTAFPGDAGAELENVAKRFETLEAKNLPERVEAMEASAHLKDIVPFAWGATLEECYIDNGASLIEDEVNERLDKGAVIFIHDLNRFVYKLSDKSYFKYWAKSSYERFYNFELDEDGLPKNEQIRQDAIFLSRQDNLMLRWNGEKLVEFGGSAAGNTINVTESYPKTGTTDPYYTLAEAIAVVANDGKGTLGIQLTFAVSKGTWKTYQFVGTSMEVFAEESNWDDMAGMSAGTEPFINVNALCGDTEYTLSTAIKAVLDKEAENAIRYFKTGIVLTYKTANVESNGTPVWESFQYTRGVNDINPADTKPWVVFGGGGSNLEAKDDPAAGGKDAFSTGGAYRTLPTKNKVTQEDGTVTIQLLNEAEEEVGEPIQFMASTGGSGEASGTIVSIVFEKSPLAGAVGKEITGKACIRSITQVGGKEQLNSITSLRLIDRESKVTVREWTVNQASSDEDVYDFEIPFGGYFEGAASRKFQLIATDDTDHEGQRNITVTAVDATIQCTQSEQVLNYSSDYAIPYGGTKAVNIPLYKFPQNVSEKGIQAFIEVFYKGEWRPLTATPPTHLDAYTNTAQFNPSNLFGGGEKMEHGAYPVRIYGKDVASGVKGNTIYTAVMCIDPTSSVPVVALRYNDTSEGTVKLYDRIKVEVAAYNPQSLTTNVEVKADNKVIGRSEVGQTQVFATDMQVAGYTAEGDDKINLYAEAYQGDNVLATSGMVSLTVKGSAIDASLMKGALYQFDFSGRSNSEPTHEIEDEGFKVALTGTNWSSNGFVKYLGQNALRIAENVKGEINHAPFASRTVEGTGIVWQCMFATNNIKDDNALLLQCYDPDAGAGFYIKGNKVGMTCKSGSPAKIERRFPCGEIHTMAVVVEPQSISINRNGTEWCTMRLYVDGELIGSIGYNPGGSRLLNTRNITMDGTYGDLYLYYMLAYNSYYDWSQAFRNYVVKLPDTDEMIAEFNKEDVLVSQNAEGSTSMRPSAPLMFAKGMPYCVFVADDEVFNIFDFGKGADDNGTSTSDKFTMTVFYYDPVRPWRSFKAIGCEIRRQGTTSAKRPKKNYRIYIKKAKEIIALYPDYTNEDALITYKLFAMKKIRVGVNTIPVDVITIKVDYSNSGGANDSSVCDMVNATYRSMGDEFLTPAQRCFDGTWDKGDVHLTGLEMNHSTANHPIAVFRSNSDTLQNVYFEAKGNWKEDKGEQVALGFKDTPGYNKGCLNYQDGVFKEIIGVQGETLDQLEARFKTMENLDTEKLYLLTMYCGRNYRFMRYQNGAWKDTTGSWIWQNGKPVITGDVLNPVGGFELLTYEQLDWWQGVGSVADMMAPSKNVASWVKKLITDKPALGVTGDEFPVWTYFFECMVDDDQLQADFAMGRKVPFELYIQLRFGDYCDYNKHDDWVERFSMNAWKFRNVRSDMVYLADADYQNEFDSLSKNHQPMHFLLEGMNCIKGVYVPTRSDAKALDGINGEFTMAQQPIVQNANKKYDIDGAYMSDNDGGDTGEPEADPTKPSDEATDYINPWAGWGAVPWRAYFASDVVYVDDTNTIEYKKIVAGMRSCTTTLSDGRKINPFSPEGAKYYFIESRLKRWPKVVSSYDGIRKYIKYTATSDALYFYALQGLGLTALAQFIDQRWRYRDGYYKTGGFFTGVLSGRIACASDAYIRIVAAKSGYYGMGNDSSGSLSADGAVYLEEGQEYIFRNFSHQQGALLYIYQADRIREIEFHGVSLSDNFDFSVMVLAEKIVVGGEDYVNYNIGYNPLTAYKLGDLPFLRHLDLRNTPAENVDSSKCPRLETLLAGGSALTEFDLAETSPVSVLELPASVTQLNLVNLPSLTYPGGLTLAGMQNVTRLMLSGCEFVDPMALINGIITASSLRYIRMPNVNITAPSSILTALRNSGAVGLDAGGQAYQESGRCSGITGRWIMEDLIEDEQLADLAAYFPQLEVINSQFSMVTYNDAVEDSENITNHDNKTGYEYNTPYVASGHFMRLEKMSKGVRGLFNSSDEAVHCLRLDDDDYNFLMDGSSIDLTDGSGMGYDIFKHVPNHWYKGVNDFKNQMKYSLRSICTNEPISTSRRITRKQLSDILVEANSALVVSSMAVGDVPMRTLNANMSVYEIDVQGMKQVRWPGINNNDLGCVFLDEDGKIMSIFKMAISHSQFDFMAGEDYIFCDVPAGAVKFLFTSQTGCDEQEAIAVDSAAIEAIEPDWVFRKEFLIGIYGLSIDALGRGRSISGTKAQTGDGTSTTSPAWTYDTKGVVTNLNAPTGLHRTRQDFINLCEMRGKGYHDISYEQSKDLANIIMELVGNRDIQAVCGKGCSAGYMCGSQTINGLDVHTPNGTSVSKNINAHGNKTLIANSTGNLMFGIQNFVGCNYEWMAHIAMNVTSFKDWKAKKCPTDESTYPTDCKMHIYNVQTDTERVVQATNQGSGYCISRVRHGRFMDTIAGKCSTDNSQWNKHYSDKWEFTASRCRVVGRAGVNAIAYGGLVYASASHVSSYSSASVGARLAFSGKIIFDDE